MKTRRDGRGRTPRIPFGSIIEHPDVTYEISINVNTFSC